MTPGLPGLGTGTHRWTSARPRQSRVGGTHALGLREQTGMGSTRNAAGAALAGCRALKRPPQERERSRGHVGRGNIAGVISIIILRGFEDPVMSCFVIDASPSMNPYTDAVIEGQQLMIKTLRGSAKCRKDALSVAQWLFSSDITLLNTGGGYRWRGGKIAFKIPIRLRNRQRSKEMCALNRSIYKPVSGHANRTNNRRIRALFAALFLMELLLSISGAWGAWPYTTTVFDDPVLPVDSIGVTHRYGEHWFVAEVWNDAPAVLSGQVYVKHHIPGVGFSARTNVGNDPFGVDRLATADRHALPSIAVDSNSAVILSMQRDMVGYGPTIENVAVYPGSLALALNPSSLIDDDSTRTSDRGRSWIAINDVLGDVWSCWTYHKTSTNDDVYCRGRRTGLAHLTWTEPILALATTAAIEDHPSVAIQTTTARRVVAYHTETGIKVRLFDASNNEDTPNDVSLGTTTYVDFPHIIDANGVLHAVAIHKDNDPNTEDEIKYATCSVNCHIDANWAKESIDDIIVTSGDSIAHPQVAVDAAAHVFVAFQHTPAGLGAAKERVKVTAKCATGGWDNDGGELVDDSQGREQVGGHLVLKALPAFVFDDTNSRLSVTYVQAVGGVDRIGRWARKDTTLAYTDICAGQ